MIDHWEMQDCIKETITNINTTLFIIIGILSFSSCSYRVIDYTTISSKNTNMYVPEESMSKRVSGEHFVATIWFGSEIFGPPNLKEATDRAIEKAGPGYDQLIDGVVTRKRKWFILFGQVGYHVEGTAIKSKDINSNLFGNSDDSKIRALEAQILSLESDLVQANKATQIAKAAAKDDQLASDYQSCIEQAANLNSQIVILKDDLMQARAEKRKEPVYQAPAQTVVVQQAKVELPARYIQFTATGAGKSFSNLSYLGTVISEKVSGKNLYRYKIKGQFTDSEVTRVIRELREQGYNGAFETK